MIRIGIICPSEIAFRRFMPALKKCNGIIFAGIAIATPEEWFGALNNISEEQIEKQQSGEYSKAQNFIKLYGGEIFEGYNKLISSDKIDAIYIPLPPALHYKWAKLALLNNKHVFLEKPSTTCLSETMDLISIASERELALHENYMFIYHTQLEEIKSVVDSGEIGDVRLYRITFGFPRRDSNDFRYNKSLGGGALFDAGGYCLKYANWLLGGNARIISAQMNYLDEFEVDMYGSGTMVNTAGSVVQLAFGMDNDYRCDIEIWGSNGTITSGRILTAPEGLIPFYTIKKNQDIEKRNLSSDDTFFKSIKYFIDCVGHNDIRIGEYEIIKRQGELVDKFYSKSKIEYKRI